MQYHHAEDEGNDDALGVRLGYGVGNGFSAGIALDKVLRQHLADDLSATSQPLGVGLFARYEQALGNGASWYIAPAVSFQHYRADFHRGARANTEAGVGNAAVRSTSYALLAGYQRAAENGSQWQVYGGLRHSAMRRGAYAEADSLAFPAQYDAVRLDDTALTVGVSGSLPLAAKWSLSADAEVAQRIAGGTIDYQANMPSVGKASVAESTQATRGSLSAGIHYHISPDMSVSLTPRVATGLFGGAAWDTQLRLQGRF